MFKCALVTGASSGIGRELCKILAFHQIPLLITGRDKASLDALRLELRSFSTVESLPCDLAKADERALLIDKMHELKPDLVVNAAGFGLYGEISDHALEDELAMIDVNIRVVVELTWHAVSLLKEEKREGVIVNVSSVAAYFSSFPQFVTYAASKNFVLSFSKGMDRETKKYGIRVLTSLPGQVDTEFRKRAAKGLYHVTSNAHMSVSFAAKEIWKQIQKRESTRVFDVRYKWAIFFAKLIPKCILNRFLENSINLKN